MSKSGTIQASIAIIAGIAVVSWLQLGVFNKTNTVEDSQPNDKTIENTDASIDDVRQTIKQINSSCPKNVDEQTRIDSAVYLPGNVFAEYFTLLSIEKLSVDSTSIKPSVTESICKNLKISPLYAPLRANNVTFAFIYKGNTGAPLFSISITPSQYNN